MKLSTLAALLTPLLVAPLAAQAEWRSMAFTPTERQEAPFCYDSLRGRSVLCGGIVWSLRYTDTWTYTNGTWDNLDLSYGPQLFNPACAYDSIRDRIVLFGYTMTPGNRVPTTLEFDGTQWINRNPLNAPDSNQHSTSSQALAFDAARGVTVMVVGQETWEWDGNDWTQAFPTNAPWFPYGQRLVYHSGRGAVMFLEQQFNPNRTVLWEWDGSDWTLIDTTGPSRSGFGMAYDAARDKLVVFGGFFSGGPPFDETWEWDGVSWTLRQPATVPEARYAPSLCYDEVNARVVMVGGDSNATGSDRLTRRETWEWDGVDWTKTTPPAPAPRQFARIVYELHQARILQFGGEIDLQWPTVISDETWVFDDVSGWRELPQIGPSPGIGANFAMAYDEHRFTTVLANWDGTWELVGDDWVLRQVPPQGDANSYLGAMVFDSLRNRCVLMQAATPTAPLRMWSWDGSVWTELFPPTMPSDRKEFVLSYDRRRDEIVLFGGAGVGAGEPPLLGDTWIFDGVDWHQAATTGPEPRDEAGMTYDIARDRTVLHGGWYFGPSQSGRTWEWDGTSWSQPAVGYRRAHGTDLTYDPLQRRVVGIDTDLTQLWGYGTSEPALITPYGNGCVGSAGFMFLEAAPGGLPWVGDTMRLVLQPAPGSSPTPPFFLLGATSTSLDLTTIGAPGCDLLVDPFVSVPMTPVSNTATLDVSLGTASSLVGVSLFGQAVVPDPPANALGLSFTYGIEIVPGIR